MALAAERGRRMERAGGRMLCYPRQGERGEVASMHERGVERGKPREPRDVETLCAVGPAASADQEERNPIPPQTYN